jgi:hypothetical protein
MPIGVEHIESSAAEMSADQITRNLIRIVSREAEHLDALLLMLTRQQRSLVEGDISGVQENVREQEEAIQVARELEKERCRLLELLAGHLNGEAASLTLTRLAGLLSGTYASRLKELRTMLVATTVNIERMRRQNEMLINRSLMHIGETMRLLAGSAATVPSYSANPTAVNKNAALVNRLG